MDPREVLRAEEACSKCSVNASCFHYDIITAGRSIMLLALAGLSPQGVNTLSAPTAGKMTVCVQGGPLLRSLPSAWKTVANTVAQIVINFTFNNFNNFTLSVSKTSASWS